ncbi:MAG TPA: hypothetical protein VLY23_13045 [Candidatus Acidoferrum sp.]|nr:hypothetical protein [Candidatus Acidoferrum sp.]
MTQSIPARVGYLQQANEFLLSLNLGLAVMLEQHETSHSFLAERLQFLINGKLHLHPHSKVGGYGAFFVLAVGVALCIFLVFRFFSRRSLAKQVVRTLAGPVALVAFPATWLCAAYSVGILPALPNPPRFWLFFELSVAVVCALLYLYEKWNVPAWAGILLLTIHYGVWGWLFLGGVFFWMDPAKTIFPLVGFCSFLAWAVYVSRSFRLKGRRLA